jgi:MoxR-like ATPase
MALAAWMAQPTLPPLAPLLIGEPGVGKNRLVYELSRCTRKDLYVLQGHEDVTAEDLVCAVRFSDEADKRMDYILSPLATAMLRGGICFIDEIGKLRPRALAPLASVLDERRYLDSMLLGERIYAQPGFRFIAATNTVDLNGDGLPEFVHSRLRPLIEVDHPPREELERIVKTRFARVEQGGDDLLGRFWELWREHSPESPPSPRDTIYLFGLTLNLVDVEASGPEPRLTTDTGVFVQPQTRHLEEAFEQLFLSGRNRDERQPLAA